MLSDSQPRIGTDEHVPGEPYDPSKTGKIEIEVGSWLIATA
jgi:hypothetical protein